MSGVTGILRTYGMFKPVMGRSGPNEVGCTQLLEVSKSWMACMLIIVTY